MKKKGYKRKYTAAMFRRELPLHFMILPGLALVLLFSYVLAVMGCGVKAAVCPFNSWLPQAGVAPTPVTALLHAVAMCCVRTAVPYIVGIIGEFVGLLSMFLPYTWLIKGTPWGYYGALMLLWSEYDRTTRISTYFYREIDWAGFAEIVIITMVIYIVGRIVFCRIES